MGWLNIYAAVYDENHKNIFDLSQSYGRQMIFIISAFVIGIFILALDSKFFSQFAYGIYFVFLIMLLGVLATGKTTAGSKSWFEIAGFSLQPAEFAKFATALAIAKYLSATDIHIKELKTKFVSSLLILLPALLILMQNDTGSALVFAAFILPLYREGLSGNILILGLIIAVLFILSLIINKFILSGIILGLSLMFTFLSRKNRKAILATIAYTIIIVGFIFTVDFVFEKVLGEHQKTRINVLLGKEIDLKGAGYNVNQSKIAIGSGGLWGKGFLQGTQTKFNFVPEQSTDFIFCTVGEEWGFVGSFVVISLLIGLLIRLIFLAERQRSVFSRIFGYSIASIIFMHFFVNIGMATGILPVIGIPLPFFSYGGSSLWAFTIMLFVFIKQDSYRLNLL